MFYSDFTSILGASSDLYFVQDLHFPHLLLRFRRGIDMREEHYVVLLELLESRRVTRGLLARAKARSPCRENAQMGDNMSLCMPLSILRSGLGGGLRRQRLPRWL